ncbi:hypothetical protein ACWGB8_21620 [Kitasatospora sp. NPDC054939]
MPLREPGWPGAGRLRRGDGDERCRPCLGAYLTANPVAKVLAALPAALMRACGGSADALVRETVYEELQRLAPEVLIARIERRWWTFWSHRPLRVPRSEADQGYGPDDVAYWLVLPHPCREAQCEDGWLLDDSGVCPVCRPAGRMVPETVDWEPEQRADPVRAAAIAADIRRELRWRHGAPRSGRRRPAGPGSGPGTVPGAGSGADFGFDPGLGSGRGSGSGHDSGTGAERMGGGLSGGRGGDGGRPGGGGSHDGDPREGRDERQDPYGRWDHGR